MTSNRKKCWKIVDRHAKRGKTFEIRVANDEKAK